MDEARKAPGIVAVFESAELVNNLPSVEPLPLPIPGLKKPTRKAMAIGRARYVGDPIAVVLAENLYSAFDARDLVEVDFEPLPVVIDPEEALTADAPYFTMSSVPMLLFARSQAEEISKPFLKTPTGLRVYESLTNALPLVRSKRAHVCLILTRIAVNSQHGYLLKQYMVRGRC